jgi:hypothetical protein
MQALRNRLGIRDLVLIITLAIGIPSFNLVSAQDPTLQVSKPKTSHSAETASNCGDVAGDDGSAMALPYRIGFVLD